MPNTARPACDEVFVRGIEPIAPEHQLESRTLGEGIVDVRSPARKELRESVCRRLALVFACQRIQLFETLRREGRKQAPHVPEVMGGSAMRHAGAPRALAQREAFHAVVRQHRRGGVQQRALQLPMVIAARRFRLRPDTLGDAGSSGLRRS